MRNNINKTLARLGLKEQEQRVYTICISCADGLFAQDISEKAKIKRSSVDLVIDRMIEQGFLTRQRIGRRYRYLAQNPETILFRKEQALDDFKEIIPLLNRLNIQTNDTDIRFFEGMNGIRQMYQECMVYLRMLPKEKRSIWAITSGVDLTKAIPDFENFWVKHRTRLKIPVKIIAPKSSEAVTTMTHDPSKYRYARYFDDSTFPYKIGVEIFADDMVGIFSNAKPIRGIVIRDPLMAQSFRCLFEMMWNFLPESK